MSLKEGLGFFSAAALFRITKPMRADASNASGKRVKQVVTTAPPKTSSLSQIAQGGQDVPVHLHCASRIHELGSQNKLENWRGSKIAQ